MYHLWSKEINFRKQKIRHEPGDGENRGRLRWRQKEAPARAEEAPTKADEAPTKKVGSSSGDGKETVAAAAADNDEGGGG